MTWFLNLRVDTAGGGLASAIRICEDAAPRTLEALTALARNRDLVLVTHGFNVDQKAGINSLSLWQQCLSLPANALYIGVLWPGDSSWLHGLDYPAEGSVAIGAGRMLADFILRNFAQAASLSLASHSLGARVMLQTIRGLGGKMRVNNLMLMAGAIDDTCLDGEYADIAQTIDRISVLSSFHDEVLAWAFPLGNLAAGILTRGSPYWHAALGREGPDTVLGGKVQSGWQVPDAWRYGHHNYLPQVLPPVPHLAVPGPFPPPQTPAPTGPDGWQPAWSAAITSKRFGG